MKLGRALNLRATHENTLVMRRSLDGNEYQGDERGALWAVPLAVPHWAGSSSQPRLLTSANIMSRLVSVSADSTGITRPIFRCCPIPDGHVMQDYTTRSEKARVTAAVRLETFSLP